MAKRDSTSVETQDPTPPPHGALEDIIEGIRVQLMTAHSVLSCATEAVHNQHLADEHEFMLADVMNVASGIIQDTTERLDSAHLRAFYDLLERGSQADAPPIPKPAPGNLTFRVHGHPHPILTVDPNITACGELRDGLAFALHGGGAGSGGREDRAERWVMAFADLEAVYGAAKALRTMTG